MWQPKNEKKGIPQNIVVKKRMDKEIKREARKQYFHYFRIWFLVLAVLAVICGAVSGLFLIRKGSIVRRNNEAPAERVYDYADVLTAEEEQKLREYIAECEEKYHIDLVLVTINEDVESLGYWNTVMMNTADDFYDGNLFGYNRIHGNGALLLDNWYEDEYGSQKGSWLSTCGVVETQMSNADIDRVLDAVYYRVDADPYEAYRAYVTTTCEIVGGDSIKAGLPGMAVVILPVLVAFIYAVAHLHQKAAKDTVTASTYVAGGKPVMHEQSDNFIRKNVVTRHIETSSGGSGGHSGGGGGHHTSSGGVSHGGGGRRR